MYRLQLFGEPVLDGPPAEDPAGSDGGGEDRGSSAPDLWRPQTALLAFLALSPDLRSDRSVLAGTLWPESTSTAARRSLRQILYRLRHDVAELVLPEADRLRLNEDLLEVDVCRFEAHLARGEPAAAAALYTGAFLHGFSLPSSTVFDPWADGERARLDREATHALATLSDDAVGEGRWEDGIRWAERWVEVAPFSEAAARRLLVLYGQTGDRGRALAFFEGYRERLSEELRLAPDPELERLAERIRSAPRRPAGAVAPAAGIGSSSPEGEEERLRFPFIGRREEFGRISSRWERARAGRHQLVVLHGEPGIGKSALAAEFAAWARLEGATVMQARAHAIESQIPYAALAGALRSAVGAPGLAGASAAALGEVSRIVPEIASRWEHGVATPVADMEAGRVRLMDGFREVLDSLAYERPVLLVLDDLPRADGATIAVLHYAWRRLPEIPLLVLLTARADELSGSAAANAFVDAVSGAGDDEVERIEVGPLHPTQIARFLRVAGYEPAGEHADLPRTLREVTGGNPLFLTETLRARAEGLTAAAESASLRSIVRARLERIGRPARALLEAAAVIGREFPLPLAGDLAGLDIATRSGAARELLGRHLIREIDYGYDFTHGVVRRILYADLGKGVRREMHERAFRRLEPFGDGTVSLERAALLARHAARANLEPEAFAWLLRASGLARDVYAAPQAATFLERAARFAAGPRDRRRVTERRADLARLRSRFDEAATAYLEAIRTAEPGSPERLRLRIRTLDSTIRGDLLDPASAEPLLRALVEETRDGPAAARRDVRMIAAESGLHTGRAEAACAHAASAVAAAREADEPGSLVRALLLLARARGAARHLEGLLEPLEEAARTAADHELEGERWDAEIDRATELSRLGRWEEALEAWEEVRERAAAKGELGSVAICAVNLADTRIARGELGAAEAEIVRAEEICDRTELPHIHISTLVNRARIHWHRSDTASAARAAAEAARVAGEAGLGAWERTARALLVLATLEHGSASEARPAAEAVRALLGVEHTTWSDGHDLAAIALARQALRERNHGDAADVLESALARVIDPYGQGVLRLEAANAFASADPARARELGREGTRILRRLGARPLPGQPAVA